MGTGYVANDADGYERSMGRWSRLLAEQFVAALDLPEAGRFLDAGCGTGALATALNATSRLQRISK